MEGGKGNRLHHISGTKVIGTVATDVFNHANTPSGILDAVELQYKGFALFNTSAATFTSGAVLWSHVDDTDATKWGTIDGTSFSTLGSAVLTMSYLSDQFPARYYRIRAAVASGSVATVAWGFNT